MDIGLIDTMEDLFVNFIGATVFSVIGYFYLKYEGKGKGRIAKNFIPQVMESPVSAGGAGEDMPEGESRQ